MVQPVALAALLDDDFDVQFLRWRSGECGILLVECDKYSDGVSRGSNNQFMKGLPMRTCLNLLKRTPLLTALNPFLPLTAVVLALIGCSGSAVVDPGVGGAAATGSGASTNTASSGDASSSTLNVTTGPGGCTTHEDCPGGLCRFATGECTSSCDSFCDACEVDTICDDCATSSCPDCLDCVAACIPIQDGQCDDNDSCPSDQICYWQESRCLPTCDAGSCADPNMVCEECLTGSCCGCEDCEAACIAAD